MPFGISQMAERSAMITTLAKPLTYPEDALQSIHARSWFRPAFNYVNVDLGEEFVCTLQSWIQLERTKDWVSSPKGIACKNRPKELTRWIMNGRYDRNGNEPRFENDELVDFGRAFVTWWTSLMQTVSEPKRGGLKRKRIGMDTLNTSGKNGWFSIVVCLKWWGMGLGEHRAGVLGNDWRQSVKEVCLTLDELVTLNAPVAERL
ncbi:hypothetical protein FB446DRAFT_220725 [Lentinula raphanica]|nr:hypothetical protein FB446DRAFT_220725 [Lentinula raphanica]